MRKIYEMKAKIQKKYRIVLRRNKKHNKKKLFKTKLIPYIDAKAADNLFSHA